MPPRIRAPSFSPFVCPSCQSRVRSSPRFISTSTPLRTSTQTPQSKEKKLKHTRLTSRDLIRITGRDIRKYLHDLLPANILERPPEAENQPIYTAFLAANGRVLNDVFIYPPPGEVDKEQPWYIEVDPASSEYLLQHLRKHKLRSKIKMEHLPQESMAVYYMWPGDQELHGGSSLGGQDPRAGMGTRWVLEPEQAAKKISNMVGGGSDEVTLKDYTIHRMLNGVAEGQSELIAASALPMESNIEFFGGIDFHKGCYLGQELTIRTHHTGVVRKRILPCQIYDSTYPAENTEKNHERLIYSEDTGLPIPLPESNLAKASSAGKGRSVGKWLGGVGNIGLALCRLEVVTDIQLTEECTHYNPDEEFKVKWQESEDGPMREVKVKPVLLPWLRQRIIGSLEKRKKRSKREEAEEEAA